MKEIIFLYPSPIVKVVTGGHKYESDLRETIMSDKEFKLRTESLISNRSLLNKAIAPFKGIAKAFTTRKADIVFLNGVTFMYTLLYVWLRKIISGRKTIIIHHHFHYLSFKGFKRYIFQMMENIFLNSADVVTPSPYMEKELKKRGIKKVMLWQIPFQIDEKNNIRPAVGNLAYVGTIEERKGLSYLFEALSKIDSQKYHLTIIGKVVESKYYENLKRYAAEKDLNVEFTGLISEEYKERILSTSDIFTFPSLLEGYGMVLVEAQTYGLPIICFNTSAMPMTVRHNENGMLCEPGDVETLAKHIETLIDNRELRNRLSRQSLVDSKNQFTKEEFDRLVLAELHSIPIPGEGMI